MILRWSVKPASPTSPSHGGAASDSIAAISARASGVTFAAASFTSRRASQESQPHPFLA